MSNTFTQAEAASILDMRKAIQVRGTEDLGYTDSGFWKFADFVCTFDEHDDANPVKRMPVKDKVYLQIVFLYMLACPKLLIPKSRQMLLSWCAATFSLWFAMASSYRRVLFQSKKADDSDAMISKGKKNPGGGRADFICQNLPEWLCDPAISTGSGNLVGSMVFTSEPEDANGLVPPWRGSRLEAIPGGADQVRSKTASAVFVDEASFHDDLDEVVIATNPAVAGGGKFCVFSSVNSGSDFNSMVLDTVEGSEPDDNEIHPSVAKAMKILGIRWPRGLQSWQTEAGYWVLKVHYTADPEKDPDRDGREWVKEAAKGYPGGMKSMGWKREMEIDMDAGGGEKVFPFLTQSLSPVFIDSLDPKWAMARMNVFAGYDYGTNNPSAFIVWGMDEQGKLYALWELYEPCLDYKQHFGRIKRCPYFKKLDYIAADNKIFSKTQQTAAGLKSVGELFHEEQIYISRARQGVDYPIAMRFLGDYWSDPDKPTAFITAACPNLRMEVRGLKFQEHISSVVSSRKNNPEKLVDKHNHAWDASAYAIDRKPSRYVPGVDAEPRDSITAFIERAEKSRPSSRIRRGGIVCA